VARILPRAGNVRCSSLLNCSCPVRRTFCAVRLKTIPLKTQTQLSNFTLSNFTLTQQQPCPPQAERSQGWGVARGQPAVARCANSRRPAPRYYATGPAVPCFNVPAMMNASRISTRVAPPRRILHGVACAFSRQSNAYRALPAPSRLSQQRIGRSCRYRSQAKTR